MNNKKLGPVQKTIVGVQFLFVAFGATVLVPLLVGMDPSVALFTAGVGTLIFHMVTKGKVPIFDNFDVAKQIKSLFAKYVSLRRGAYLIVEHTEAMHVIDVNSGNRTKAEDDQEQTALEVNLAAAAEIARQLRLRDMGGIVIVDFIDMRKQQSRQTLYQEMQKLADTLYKGEAIKAKDLILGATYGTANGSAYVYMGKSDYWDYERNYYYADNDWNRRHGHVGYAEPLDDTWETNIADKNNHKYRNINKGKRFWFISANGGICSYSTISKKFYSVIDSNVTEKFAEYQDLLDNHDNYSPFNYSSAKVIPWTFEEFKEFAYKINSSHGWDNYKCIPCYQEDKWKDIYLHRRANQNLWYYEKQKEIKDGYWKRYETIQVNGTLEELYEQLNPARVEIYLMNGKLYKGWY